SRRKVRTAMKASSTWAKDSGSGNSGSSASCSQPTCTCWARKIHSARDRSRCCSHLHRIAKCLGGAHPEIGHFHAIVQALVNGGLQQELAKSDVDKNSCLWLGDTSLARPQEVRRSSR